jgi:Fe-S-cluster containining protein
MAATPENHSEYVQATAELSLSGRRLQIEMTIPTKPTAPVKLLPLFQSLAEAVVSAAAESAEQEGLTISCRKGCGACCRQLVPIAPVEARRLRDLVNDMPEPRRSEIHARFAAARGRLQESGLLEKLLSPVRRSQKEAQEFGLEYFYQGIACPFLEDESCSIHSDRPIACREYLVTSPANNCSAPTAETVQCLKLPGKVSGVVRRLNDPPGSQQAPYVPLIMALEWAENAPDDPVTRPATDVVREAFSLLSGKEIAGASI